jgi:hypothetical protein
MGTIKTILSKGLLAVNCLIVLLLSYNADAHTITISFRNFVGDKPLELDKTYKNSLGQSFTVTNFKYYISNIRLTSENGESYTDTSGFYLIRQDEKSTWDITLNVPFNMPFEDLKRIKFSIGVDSLHNCSGAQSGALDPINGMFWTWNSGYIFFKLEGKSPASTSPGHIFEYHIGGYKNPNNSIREIELPQTSTIAQANDTVPKIKIADPGNIVGLTFKADILKLLDGPNIIDFSKLSSVTGPTNSSVIADNFKNMFMNSFIIASDGSGGR